MSKTNTLPNYLQPLMGHPSVKTMRCCVCGRPYPLEQHHFPFRSAGAMYDEKGKELKKPTFTLCGFGNHLKDANGNLYCHGMAHARMLHFRWSDEIDWWECLVTDEPVDYLDALTMEGWRRL